jgi:hypothetical protein
VAGFQPTGFWIFPPQPVGLGCGISRLWRFGVMALWSYGTLEVWRFGGLEFGVWKVDSAEGAEFHSPVRRAGGQGETEVAA